MTIWQAFKHFNIPVKKRYYFQAKHGIWMKQPHTPMTEEEICRKMQLIDLSTYKEWEKSDQYQKLLFCLLEGSFAADIADVYRAVSDKAKTTGDEKAIKNMLMLQKEIKRFGKVQEPVQEQDDDFDGLMIG